MRKTRAIINLTNLKSNYLKIRKKVSPSRILAVVKADAYGHGMEELAQYLQSLDSAPEYFGVALYEEAVSLRKVIRKTPILVFAPLTEEDLKFVAKFKIMPTVFSDEHLAMLKVFSGRKIQVHIKVDTGMGRLGVHYSRAFLFVKELAEIKNIEIAGIYTHFATSDEKDKSFAQLQLQRFMDLISEVKSAGIDTGLVHSANSGAILDMPESYFDMVRPGISLYGYYPSQETTESIRLKPVMSIISEIDSVKTIQPGESISYGRKYIARKKETIITVPFGYADGFPRTLTGKTSALYKGKSISQAGTITMDRTAYVVHGTVPKGGERITLIGKDKKEQITADTWAAAEGTIPYEILCGISKRVPRVYVQEEKE